MLLSSRLPRALLSIIYIIVISAGVGVEHNIGGSVAVCSIHLAFRLLPDNCFCISGKPYNARDLEEDVYDSISLVTSITGCIFGVLQNALGDSGVAVSVSMALLTTVAFAIGKSVVPPRPLSTIDPNSLFDDDEEEGHV